MDATGIAALIASLVTAITAIVGGAGAVYRFAKAQAKASLLQEQSQATILAKDKEIHELKAERDDLREINSWLRTQVPSHLQEKSQ